MKRLIMAVAVLACSASVGASPVVNLICKGPGETIQAYVTDEGLAVGDTLHGFAGAREMDGMQFAFYGQVKTGWVLTIIPASDVIAISRRGELKDVSKKPVQCVNTAKLNKQEM